MTNATLDFANLNYVAGMPHREYRSTTDDYFYNGPSTTVQQIVIAVAAQNIILPISAPAPNASWDFTFSAPNLECDEVPSNTQTAIEQSIYDYLVVDVQKKCFTPPIFSAWYARVSEENTPLLINEPYAAAADSSNNSTREAFLTDADAILTEPRAGGLLVANEIFFFAAVFPGLATATYLTH